ncbi:hypothetical protein RDG66_12900 [Vibrio cholerae]
MYKITSIIWAFITLLTLYPYFIWENGYVLKASFLTLIVFFFITIGKGIDRKVIVLFVLYLFWIIYGFLPRGDEISFVSTGVMLILLYILSSEQIKTNAFKYFRRMLMFVLLVSLLQYPIIALNFLEPIGQITPSSLIKLSRGQYYNNYIFNVILNDQYIQVFGLNFFRFSSVFDEPGLVGTISAILLFTYDDRTDGKYFSLERKIYIISLILSFSLGGYLLYILGVILNEVIEKRKSIKKYVVYVPMILSVAFLIFNSDAGEKYIIDRIWINGEFNLVSNRTDNQFNLIFDGFTQSSTRLIFGDGKDAHARLGVDVSSYKGFLYNFGVIGILYLALTMLYTALSFGRINIEMKILIFIILVINTYQRPIDFNYYYYFIFLSICMRKYNNGVKND